MTKENSYLVSSPFFLGLLLRAVGRSGNLEGSGQVYSNPTYLKGKRFDSIPAKIWVVIAPLHPMFRRFCCMEFVWSGSKKT